MVAMANFGGLEFEWTGQFSDKPKESAPEESVVEG